MVRNELNIVPMLYAIEAQKKDSSIGCCSEISTTFVVEKNIAAWWETKLHSIVVL